MRFLPEPPPEEVRRYGAGYPLREEVLGLFFAERPRGDGGGEEWEEFAPW